MWGFMEVAEEKEGRREKPSPSVKGGKKTTVDS